MSLTMSLTCSEGGKARAVNGETIHWLTTAATAAAASCGGAQNQAASPVACRVLQCTEAGARDIFAMHQMQSAELPKAE